MTAEKHGKRGEFLNDGRINKTDTGDIRKNWLNQWADRKS